MSNRPPLNWGAEALWLQLEPLLPGLSVEVVAETASTNSALLARARLSAADPAAGDGQPCLLVAEHQTQGRGRQGKAWWSNAGSSLTFSLSLPLAPADWSGLSLAVGLALADALEPPRPGQAPRLGIKWPNDLLLADEAPPSALPTDPAAAHPGRKLGGILIETVQVGGQRQVVVGVGLNLLPLPAEASIPAAASAPSGWGQAHLQALDAAWASAPAVLARVAAPLLRALLAFERDGFAPLRARFAARDRLWGHAVSTTLPGLPLGVADGVDDTGTLWLRVDDAAGARRVPVRSGEVSLRLATEPSLAPPAASGPAC